MLHLRAALQGLTQRAAERSQTSVDTTRDTKWFSLRIAAVSTVTGRSSRMPFEAVNWCYFNAQRKRTEE